MKIRDDFKSAFIYVPRWAITRLKLSGDELIVYSVIFTHVEHSKLFTGGDSVFQNGIKYLSTWTNSYHNALKALDRLIDKGYVVGDEHNGYRCDFSALDDMIMNDSLI